MKYFYTLSFVMLGLVAFSQQKNTDVNSPASSAINQTNTENTSVVIPRNSAGSVQSRTSQPAPLPYDVNDKFMGRADEFLGNLTVSKLPLDFPIYEKQWTLKEYNEVVTAFYYNHLDIVKEGVKRKLELLQH
jgi:hypothetical protein